MGGLLSILALVRYGWEFNPIKKLKSATTGNLTD